MVYSLEANACSQPEAKVWDQVATLLALKVPYQIDMQRTDQFPVHVQHPGIVNEQYDQTNAQQSEEKMAEVGLVNDVLHPQQVKAFTGTFAQHL